MTVTTVPKVTGVSTPLTGTATQMTVAGAANDGVTDDSSAFAATLATIGATSANLQISAPMLLNANTTIPANVQLTFIGAGLIKPGTSKTITINGAITAGAWKIFDTSNSGALINGNLRNDRVYAEWFGAIADGTTDSTTAINSALVLAHAASDIPVQLLAGTYVCSSTIVATGSSFTRPNLMGVSKKRTILNFATIAASSVCLKIRGGSGQITGDAVSDLTLTGNSTSILLEFNGACGAKGRNILFGSGAAAGAAGCRWHNEAVNDFTEFCTLEGCEIQNGVTLPFEYKITSGNNSFHGSGPGGGPENIVVRSTTGPVLQADGTGTFIYNAPFHVQVFATSADCTVFQNNNSVAPVPITFSGVLSIETTTSRTITLGAGAQVLFAGPVKLIGATNLTGDNIVAGTLLRVETVSVHGDSSVSFSGAKRGSKYALTVPSASMAGINISGSLNNVGRLVSVSVFATNYLSQQLIVTSSVDGSSSGTGASICGQQANFNNPGGSLGYQAIIAYTGSTNGSFNITVPTVSKVATASFTGGETSATLTISWQSPTGTYNFSFSNGDVRAVSCTQSSTSVTWTGGLSAAATTALTCQTWPVGSGTFTAYTMETQISNGIQASGHMQF